MCCLYKDSIMDDKVCVCVGDAAMKDLVCVVYLCGTVCVCIKYDLL